jgi:hypothetical protein
MAANAAPAATPASRCFRFSRGLGPSVVAFCRHPQHLEQISSTSGAATTPTAVHTNAMQLLGTARIAVSNAAARPPAGSTLCRVLLPLHRNGVELGEAVLLGGNARARPVKRHVLGGPLEPAWR